MCRGVEVLALLPGAAALDVVHAHGHRVVAGVDHGAVAGVGEAAVRLAPSAVASLELSAHLGGDRGEEGSGSVTGRLRLTTLNERGCFFKGAVGAFNGNAAVGPQPTWYGHLYSELPGNTLNGCFNTFQ